MLAAELDPKPLSAQAPPQHTLRRGHISSEVASFPEVVARDVLPGSVASVGDGAPGAKHPVIVGEPERYGAFGVADGYHLAAMLLPNGTEDARRLPGVIEHPIAWLEVFDRAQETPHPNPPRPRGGSAAV